jgi:hypothetical protein
LPRLLQLIALSLALLLVGAPAILAEIAEDDCVEECAGDDEGTTCPDEGCTDCSVVCPSCPRTHAVAVTVGAWFAPWRTASLQTSNDASERVPVDPPREGVFHPPRLAG